MKIGAQVNRPTLGGWLSEHEDEKRENRDADVADAAEGDEELDLSHGALPASSPE